MHSESRPTILLLEWRPKRLALLSDCLSIRYNIIVAHSIPEATKYLDEQSEKIDCVISCFHSDSKESVFDLLRKAKQVEVPLIFFCLFPSHFTRTIEDSLVTTARMLGAESTLLQEHLDTHELLETIEQILANHTQFGTC
jgi:response regulator RpfG family c-di-GMP phosphodiesterase